MRFFKLLSLWTVYVLFMSVCAAGALGLFHKQPPLHTAIPGCLSTHKQLVVVPVECGKSDICEAPLIVDVCDELRLPTNTDNRD